MKILGGFPGEPQVYETASNFGTLGSVNGVMSGQSRTSEVNVPGSNVNRWISCASSLRVEYL
jgi:hypothetical protein